MYVLVVNNAVSQYPYSIKSLREAHPNVSFPKTLSPEVLSSYNVFEVQQSERPTVDHTKNVVESNPALVGNTWMQQWATENASAEEIAERVAYEEAAVRDQRNHKLQLSDWTQMLDSPLTDAKKLEWSTYRQSLRDITSQSGFPFNVTYPANPS